MAWLVLLPIVALGAFLFVSLRLRARRSAAGRGALQLWCRTVPEASDTAGATLEVHFPSMLARWAFGDGTSRVRLSEVRREDNGVWAYRYTPESLEMEIRFWQHHERRRLGKRPRSTDELREIGQRWRPMPPADFSLEPAYQRFRHTSGIVVATPPWRAEEATQAEREAALLAEEGTVVQRPRRQTVEEMSSAELPAPGSRPSRIGPVAVGEVSSAELPAPGSRASRARPLVIEEIPPAAVPASGPRPGAPRPVARRG